MSEPKYRAVSENDFNADGKGKPGLKFYESDDGTTPKESNNPLTEPTKDPNKKYVVEDVAADEDTGEDTDAVAHENGGGDEDTDAVVVENGGGGGGGDEGDKKKFAKDALIALAEAGHIDKKLLAQTAQELNNGDPVVANDETKTVGAAAAGGRRRTKRKGRKGSKKSKKGAKKSKKSAKQSKKSGRSRKNHRKHSHRRKH